MWSKPAPETKVNKFRLFKDRAILVSLVTRNSDTGVAKSPEFTIDRTYLNFLVAGGQDGDSLTVCLLIDGEVVEKATGNDSLTFTSVTWNLAKFQGKKARLVLSDKSQSSPYGFIAINNVMLSDSPTNTGALPQFGLPDGAFQKRLSSARTVHRRYLVVPVTFDDTQKIPFGGEVIEDLFSDRYPGLSHYFRNTSYGALDLEGTKVMAWTPLPGTASAYGGPGSWSTKRLVQAAAKKFNLSRLSESYDGVIVIPAVGINEPILTVHSEDFETAVGTETTQVIVIDPSMSHRYCADALVYAEALRIGRSDKIPLEWRYDADLRGSGPLQIAQEPTAFKKVLSGWIDNETKSILPGKSYSGPLARVGAPERFDVPNALFLKLPGKDWEGWYVEFREGFGYDSPAENAQPRIAVTRARYDLGVRRYVWDRVSLAPGQSISDPDNGLSLTFKSVTTDGAIVSCASTGN